MKLLRRCPPLLLVAVVLGLCCLPLASFAQEMPEFPGDLGQEESAAAAGVGCACLVIWLLVMLAIVAVWIAICVWVYRDATRRGAENAVLWLLLVIITGLIGLIIYLIVRPGKPQ